MTASAASVGRSVAPQNRMFSDLLMDLESQLFITWLIKSLINSYAAFVHSLPIGYFKAADTIKHK